MKKYNKYFLELKNYTIIKIICQYFLLDILIEHLQVMIGYFLVILRQVIKLKIVLYQNYPNPFNPQTTIRFELDSPGNVKLTVHDVTGRWVATLVDGHRDAGKHEVRFDASRLSSGAYLYRLESGARTINRVMMLTR